MNLFEAYESMSVGTLNEYILRQQEENLQLDFKVINKSDFSHADDRKNLAKSLSGFANSSGGLIVWGIEARKNENKIDCAVGKSPIRPISLFIARLNELTGMAVSPLVEGVFHKPITMDDNESGFAVTLVPESISCPHMAKLGEDRYYKRSGDSFYKMEHFDLEDMFGRRKKPALSLYTKVQGGAPNIEIIIGIRNEGRGTAKAPYLAFSITEPFRPATYGLNGNGQDGMPRLATSGRPMGYHYGANSEIVIHPGTLREVTRVVSLSQPQSTVEIKYEIGADDVQIITGTQTLTFDS